MEIVNIHEAETHLSRLVGECVSELEVFVTANAVPLGKKPDAASGMKMIDPTQ